MGTAMVNYGIVEAGIFFMLIGVLAYFSLSLSMIFTAAVCGLGLLILLIGLSQKKPADKNKKRKK